MPGGFRPFVIGPDHVLGMGRDELDVEHVRLYALQRTIELKPEDNMAEDLMPTDGKRTDDEGKGKRRYEEYKVAGDRVVSKIKELIHEGNVRRITIRNDEGRTLIEVPLTIGVVGAVLAPVWAAIGAVAALVANCSIEVEREDEDADAGT